MVSLVVPVSSGLERAYQRILNRRRDDMRGSWLIKQRLDGRVICCQRSSDHEGFLRRVASAQGNLTARNHAAHRLSRKPAIQQVISTHRIDGEACFRVRRGIQTLLLTVDKQAVRRASRLRGAYSDIGKIAASRVTRYSDLVRVDQLRGRARQFSVERRRDPSEEIFDVFHDRSRCLRSEQSVVGRDLTKQLGVSARV